MLCQFLLYRKVNWLSIHVSPLFWISFPFRSLQSIEESFLCHTVGSHQLSILCVASIVYICLPETPNSSQPPPIPLVFMCLYVRVCAKLLQSCPTLCNPIDYKHHTRLSEKAMAPHSSTLAWKIPWTEEPGGLQSMGSLRVGHD